jgi:hypothetical protein
MTVSALDQLIAEAEAKGEAKFGRKAVLNVLCQRFKLTVVPERIKSAIQKMNDSIVLETLYYHAINCRTLDEFLLEEGVAKMQKSTPDLLENDARYWREAILNVLCRRFQTDIQEKIESAIQRINDPITLDSLHSRALDCETLDEFAEALDRWS